MAFHTLVHSKLDYAAPAWQPWLSDTNLSYLDHFQNCCLQLITGQLISTPLEVLPLEANVQSYPTCSKCLILEAIENALRSTYNHPKCIALDVNIPQCLQNCSSFCRKAEACSTHLPPDLQHRQSIIYFPPPRWQQSSSQEGWIATFVPGITGWADDSNLTANVASPPLLHISLIMLSTLMDPLVEWQEMGGGGRGQVQLLLENPHSSLKSSPPSKGKEGLLPANMRRKQLPWNLHYPGHPPTPTTLQSPYSFA